MPDGLRTHLQPAHGDAVHAGKHDVQRDEIEPIGAQASNAKCYCTRPIGQTRRAGGPQVRGCVVILVAAVGTACGRDATPAAPTPVIPATVGDLQSSLSTSFDALA